MSKRLAEGGLLIDRNKPIQFEFNGKKLFGFESQKCFLKVTNTELKQE